MSNTYSFNHEIMQLPDTGGMPCVLSNVTMYLGDYKDALQVLKEICPRGNNKLLFISLFHDKCLLFMLELY